MEIPISPEKEAFIKQAVASGRYRTAEDAVGDALERWEREERNRIELLASLDEGEADLEAGQYTDHTNATLSKLAADLKREARGQGESAS